MDPVMDKSHDPLSTIKPLQPRPSTFKHVKRQSQSGSLAYGKISDKDQNGVPAIDWKTMENICVVARFRPKNKREVRWSKANNVADKPPEYSKQSVSMEPSPLSSGSRISLDFSTLNLGTSSRRQYSSSLDFVMAPASTQKQVFYRCGVPMIGACLEGYNSTIFAYGQSGSGKTYTMMGPETDIRNIDDFGLIPRCIVYLFQKLDEKQDSGQLRDYMVNMESLQIYKSQVLDLLQPDSKGLVIKTNFDSDTVFVENLKSVQIRTVQEAFKLLTKTQQNRVVKGHALNAVSSRSHMLISMTVVQRQRDGTLKTAKLNFGDLAGSEDLTKALGRNPDAERRREAIAINRSLSALTTAISYLSKGKKPSFRDSPLTHILKDSLGGNSKTIMLVNVSPHIYNRGETIRTLRFASTAKKVKNKAKVNEQKSMGGLKKKIKELERENNKLRRQLEDTVDTQPGDGAGGISKQQPIETIEPKSKKDSMLSDLPHSQFLANIMDSDDEGSVSSVLIHDEIEHNHPKDNLDKDDDMSFVDDLADEILEDTWIENGTNCTNVADKVQTPQSAQSNNSNSSNTSNTYEDLSIDEYVRKCQQYQGKLNRETDENVSLQFQIDAQHMKITELMEELSHNERDFHDSRSKIAHLQHMLSQYQSTYPTFKPEVNNVNICNNSSGSSGSFPSPMLSRTTGSIVSSSCDIGPYQDELLTLQPRLSLSQSHRLSISQPPSRAQSVLIPNHLLESLLAMQQRTESALAEMNREIKQQSRLSLLASTNSAKSPIHYEDESDDDVMAFNELESTLSHSETTAEEGGGDINDALVYESADEKLSEWDLDVSAMGSHSEASEGLFGGNIPTKVAMPRAQSLTLQTPRSTTKHLSDHHDHLSAKELKLQLKSLSENEKRLKRDLDSKLKEEAMASSGWCQCFWPMTRTEPIQKSAGLMSGQLMEQYLKMKVRRELVKDRYQRKKERKRAKILRKRMKRKAMSVH